MLGCCYVYCALRKVLNHLYRCEEGSKWSICPSQWKENTTSASCKVRSSTGASWSGLHQQHASTTTATTDQNRTGTNAVGVPDGAINATCVRAHPLPFTCSYASCIDCCIGHSNGSLAGPDLVGDGGGCTCMLLVQPTPACTQC